MKKLTSLLSLVIVPTLLLSDTNDKTLISGFNYGVLPTNVDLVMTGNNYTFSIALLGCTCAIVFWLGWNSHT